MGKELDIALEVSNNKGVEILERELKKLNQINPIKEGEILIDTTHIEERQNEIHIGFYIRNGSSQGIIIEQIPVKFLSGNGEILDTKAFKLKKSIKVSSHRATPYSITINKIDKPKSCVSLSVDSRLGSKKCDMEATHSLK